MKDKLLLFFIVIVIGSSVFYNCGSSESSVPIEELQDPVAIDENSKITIRYFSDNNLKNAISRSQTEKAYEYFEVEFDNYDRKLKLTYWKQKQIKEIIFYIYGAEKQNFTTLKSIEYYTPQMKLQKEEFLKNGKVSSYNMYKYDETHKTHIKLIERYTAKGIKHGNWNYYTQLKISMKQDKKKDIQQPKKTPQTIIPPAKSNEKVKQPVPKAPPQKYEIRSSLVKEEEYSYGTLKKVIKYTLDDYGKRIKEYCYDGEEQLVYTFDFMDEYDYVTPKTRRKISPHTGTSIKKLADEDRKQRYNNKNSSKNKDYDDGFEISEDESKTDVSKKTRHNSKKSSSMFDFSIGTTKKQKNTQQHSSDVSGGKTSNMKKMQPAKDAINKNIDHDQSTQKTNNAKLQLKDSISKKLKVESTKRLELKKYSE